MKIRPKDGTNVICVNSSDSTDKLVVGEIYRVYATLQSPIHLDDRRAAELVLAVNGYRWHRRSNFISHPDEIDRNKK